MRTLWVVATCLVVASSTGAVGFVTGTHYGQEPSLIEVSLVAPASLGEPHTCPVPITCPPPDRHCKSLHERAVHAIGETLLADAYTRGAEDAQDAAEICEQALEERWPPTDVSCATCRYWDQELDMMDLGIQVMALNVENSNWHRACEELYRVWPTEPDQYGNYAADFPEFCQ